jgi:hypothetical protein
MKIVFCILALFVLGGLTACLAYYSWTRSNNTDKERHMSRKPKFTGAKSRTKEVIHLDYFRIYHEILKYEEVLDIELDEIFEAVNCNLLRKLNKGVKLCDVPDPIDLEIMIKEVMDKLVGHAKADK